MNDPKNIHRASCLEVGSLLEKRAAEDPLTSVEQALMNRHMATCLDCRDFHNILFGLHAFADIPSTEVAAAEANRATTRFFAGQRRMRTAAAIASLGAIAAAAAFILLRPHVPTPADPEPVTERCTPSTPVTLIEGVWMSQCSGTTLHTTTEEDGTLKVTIENGAAGLSVDANRLPKYPVAVFTPFGEVWVKGTVLTVHVDETDACVEVFRGKAAVHPRRSPSTLFDVSEGRAARLSQPPSFALKHPRGEALRKELAQIDIVATESSRVENADMTDSVARLDTDTAGEEGVSNADPRGKLRRVPLEILIQDAQSCLIAMDWGCAASKYRQIIKDYQGSHESQSALVSLAKIELRRLEHPEKALKYFNTYRTRNPKGPLAEEALLGTAEAHRRMGNQQAEAAALNELVRQYPSSTSVSKAKNRLQDLSVR